MKTINNDFSYRGEHFSIVYDGKLYMTVNHKFIGNDGHPIKELHFNDGLHPARTLSECIKQTKEDLDIQHYIASGMTVVEAFAKALNVSTEIAEMIFAKN